MSISARQLYEFMLAQHGRNLYTLERRNRFALFAHKGKLYVVPDSTGNPHLIRESALVRIPDQLYHPFRSIVTTHSGATLPVIPG